ncbi:N-acetylmuramic acid 6-phosphate etherase [bacterium]|nr:MAG: N-acetylmuramic acid 6-phosphate etherase [bacterium]
MLTEQRNDRSAGLDACSTIECLRIINDEDQRIAQAVRDQIEHIAAITDLVITAIQAGGRLIYLGAGTSGRLGVLDASECPPTFQTDPKTIVGIIAGGDRSLRKSSESKEDVPTGAHDELDQLKINKHDVVLGIAAGGTTPYVLGGVEYAKSMGSNTGLLTCTPIDKPSWCDVLIAIETGAEVLTGSTRMKAGTATKMALNMITTSAMVGLGKSYSNMMVDLRATNDKLKDRAARIIMQIADVDRERAFELLKNADHCVKPAIVMHTQGVSYSDACELLAQQNGHLGRIIERAIGERP